MSRMEKTRSSSNSLSTCILPWAMVQNRQSAISRTSDRWGGGAIVGYQAGHEPVVPPRSGPGEGGQDSDDQKDKRYQEDYDKLRHRVCIMLRAPDIAVKRPSASGGF